MHKFIRLENVFSVKRKRSITVNRELMTTTNVLLMCFVVSATGARQAENAEAVELQRTLRREWVWSEWTAWSECSLTCGRGVRSRHRHCVTADLRNHPERAVMAHTQASDRCDGLASDFVVCTENFCASDSDSRHDQCSEYNIYFIDDQTYRWTSVGGTEDECQLVCVAIGYSFRYDFGHVIDGTSCERSEGDFVCVEGECLEVGCDGHVGSGLVFDSCHVCNGSNVGCRRHFGTFARFLTNGDGYVQVAKIPAGATDIVLREYSSNYIALADETLSYVINGGWRLDWAGEYQLNNVIVVYERSNQSADEERVSLRHTPVDLNVFLMPTNAVADLQFDFFLPDPLSSELWMTSEVRAFIVDADRVLVSRSGSVGTFDVENSLMDSSRRPSTDTPGPVQTTNGGAQLEVTSELRDKQLLPAASADHWGSDDARSYGLQVDKDTAYHDDVISGNQRDNQSQRQTLQTTGQSSRWLETDVVITTSRQWTSSTSSASTGRTTPVSSNSSSSAGDHRDSDKLSYGLQIDQATAYHDDVINKTQRDNQTRQQNLRTTGHHNQPSRWSETDVVTTTSRPWTSSTLSASTDKTTPVSSTSQSGSRGRRQIHPPLTMHYVDYLRQISSSLSRHIIRTTTPASRTKTTTASVGRRTRGGIARPSSKRGSMRATTSNRSAECGRRCPRFRPGVRRQFCDAQFVAEVSVLDYHYINNTTRYDVRVDDLLSHGGFASLAEREFIWVDNICRCPRLDIGESYVIMCRLTTAGAETRETRLQLTERSVALQLNAWQQRFASRNFRCRRRIQR